jgi:uncharacterized protein YggE
MFRLMICFAILMLFPCLSESVVSAQFGGSRAGVESNSGAVAGLPMLDREVAESFIAIEGRAEVRVRPTEIRIVLAITSEGETARECHTLIGDKISKLKKSWTGMGIPAESIVEDFIAVLPVYEWELKKQGASDIGVETKTGFRMQTNVHLAVPNDANAEKAFTVAFEHGVTDIIAFDYWSKELDEYKIKAREQAVKAARSKSDLLLAALFEVVPPVINVQEQTTVRYPESLYHSFVNTHDEEVTTGWRRDIPFIRTYRPRNTFYRGLVFDGDIQARELPMHPEISVVSSVRLYFESPATKRARKEDNQDKE